MLSNAYFLAKFRFGTAENEPAKNWQNFATFANQQLQPTLSSSSSAPASGRSSSAPAPAGCRAGTRTGTRPRAAAAAALVERFDIELYLIFHPNDQTL